MQTVVSGIIAAEAGGMTKKIFAKELQCVYTEAVSQ